MKIIKSIPSIITSLNLLSGSIATILALNGETQAAVYLILLATVFDFFDGFAARLLKAVSEFGKQLDSLADLISFGLAPSALLYYFIESNQILTGYFPYVAMLIVVFSALRLAKFNIDTEQKTEFLGLPTPASALLIISICWYSQDSSNNLLAFFKVDYVIVTTILLISFLMVLPIRLLSLKIKSFKLKEIKWQVLLLSLSLILLIIFKISGIGMSIILYIALSIIKQLVTTKKILK